jgi:DNA recombination protein RmuC
MDPMQYVIVGFLVVITVLVALALFRPKGQASAANTALEDELRAQVKVRDASIEAVKLDLDRARKAEIEAVATQRELSTRYDELKKSFDDAQEKLRDAFKSLSADALKDNNAQFMTLANKELESKKQAIDDELKRLADSIKAHSDKAGALDERLRASVLAEQALTLETRSLVTALRRPEVRGNWGELTLKRTVELAGMSEHCDFFEQESVTTEKGRLRPDMVVKLPGGREIVIDAKTPLDAYLTALEAPNEEAREAALASHTKQVKDAIAKLASKDYKEQFASADFVVMFIPGDVFLDAAATRDPKLIEDAMAKGVVITTPSTLMALLKAVAMGWKEEKLAENARKIADAGTLLYDRFLNVMGYVTDVGDKLGRAATAYNKLIGSVDSRLYPSARSLRELSQSCLPEPPDSVTVLDTVRTSTLGSGTQASLPTEETK